MPWTSSWLAIATVTGFACGYCLGFTSRRLMMTIGAAVLLPALTVAVCWANAGDGHAVFPMVMALIALAGPGILAAVFGWVAGYCMSALASRGKTVA